MKTTTLKLVLLLILTHLGCNGSGSKSEASENTAEIGPEGGSITTSSGASIVVPPSALQQTETIAITYHETLTDLPADSSANVLGRYLGGVSLSPVGLEFASLVTVTIPLNENVPAGEEFVLFYFDDGSSNDALYPENYTGWQQTNFRGTVSADGRNLVVQVDHFSTYVVQMNFGGDTLDILGEQVAHFGDNGIHQSGLHQCDI